jgi:exodeoxyribonuclease VII small subunit
VPGKQEEGGNGMEKEITCKNESQLSEDDLTFDAALGRLEETVKRLEDGDLPLEEALECFKEGIGLVRICNLKLKDAETVITQLTSQENGTVKEIPPKFDLGGE